MGKETFDGTDIGGEVETIGLRGGSGHNQLDMFRFNLANMSAYTAAYW